MARKRSKPGVPDEWRRAVAKMVPSQADLDNVRSILAEPKKALRRGGNRVRYKPEPLERLIEQHPEWTNEQLRTGYEQETKALPGTPSLEWVKKQAPKLRRGMGIKE